MPLVKLSIYPEPVEVPEDEIPVLRSQGLVEDPVAPAPGADDEGHGTDDQTADKAAAKETK